MSLDTILRIGRVLKNGSEKPMKHFRYVSQPSFSDDVVFLSIPLKEDYIFDWGNICVVPEKDREQMFFLRYKTSDQDSSAAKYVFGDISYAVNRAFDNKGKLKDAVEKGNYILQKSNAFDNACKIREEYIKGMVESFFNDAKTKQDKNYLVADIRKYLNEDFANEQVANIVDAFPILFFWKSFIKNKDKIEECLRYAPIYQNKKVLNCDVEKEYLDYLFECKYDKIKKAINNKRLDEITEGERQNLLNFADHTVFVHFDFPVENQWYKQTDVFEFIVNSLNLELVTKQNEQKFVPKKSLYRTLCSGDDKNDVQFPCFHYANSYKSFAFADNEQFNDFLYANAVINKPKMWLKRTNINIYVFPASFSDDDIDAKEYENFFFNNATENSLFHFDFLSFDDETDKSIFTRFDFVFSDSGGNTTKDLIEIDGIEKSSLLRVRERISKAEKSISREKEEDLGWSNVKLSLETAFGDLLGKCGFSSGQVVFDRDCPYYQSHMLKVLPLIYTENYYEDKDLLKNLIDRVEFTIRNGEEKDYGNYSRLKYDLKLVMCIQNNQNSKYMEITESKSYQIGLLLGQLAKNLSQEINSFEKNYVGNLTRRISTMNDFIRLKNDIEQKLVMHDKVKFTYNISYELAQKVKDFDAKYDKEECAFGFLESYFMPIKKSEINNGSINN